MNRDQLIIGQKVLVNVTRIDGTKYKRVMYVRELHNKNVAGLSYTKDSTSIGSIIGIMYEIIEEDVARFQLTVIA